MQILDTLGIDKEKFEVIKKRLEQEYGKMTILSVLRTLVNKEFKNVKYE